MKRDNTPWRPQPPAEIEWDSSGTPVSRQFSDIYYSTDDGVAESQYVFVEGNDLPQRWRGHSASSFNVAECGFGTGLNFLLTWRAWREAPEPKPNLHYLSVERYPLQVEALRRALGHWPPLAALALELSQAYPGLIPGEHRLLFDGGRVRLDLWWADAGAAFADLAALHRPLIDAWYLDGFAPARNRDMWTRELCASIGSLTRPGGTFATFTAAGQVRRDLQDAGFTVEKRPGYGRKRERLVGVLESAVTITPGAFGNGAHNTTPWDLPTQAPSRPRRALVIGAGLAGCHAASALAARGIEVTILEQGAVAGAASGNDQGILYTRLSRKHSTLTDFALQSFCHATRIYGGMLESGELVEGVDGALCGSLLLDGKTDDLDYLAPLLDNIPYFAQAVDRDKAARLCGQETISGGYWLPSSGWLNPPAVCRALLRRPGIRLLEHCGPVTLEQKGDEWHATAVGRALANAPCAVVAAGAGSDHPPALSWLPLQKIRGQTSLLPALALPGELRSVICGEGYIAPRRNETFCTGASFKLRFSDLDLRQEEHEENLERLASMIPAWREGLESLDHQALEGRVGVRCASPDYLPMAGPVPDREAFIRDYAALRENAKRPLEQRGQYLPGLYLSAAHGSRGLTSTPLTAELLASAICSEPPPMSRELTRALAPARFIIRNLARNRI